jgi:hypothetical protein
MSTIHSPFSSQLIMSNFSTLLIVYPRFFTWTAISDVDLHFSLMLVGKANPVEANVLKRKLNEPRDYITNLINPYM